MDVFLELYTLEAIRQRLRHELRTHMGQQALADEIRISRGSLRKFLNEQSTPTAQVTQRLKDWAADRPEQLVPRGAVALAVLAHDLPHHLRGRARTDLARTLLALYMESGHGIPPWLDAEIDP